VNDIAAILLAAGRSRRMGAFKPLLPFGDQTVIERCIGNLLGTGVSDIIVVVGHREDEVRAHLKHSEVRFASNPDTDSEMSVSIARGLEQVTENTKAVIVALVDHPAVSSKTIGILIDEWKRGATLIRPEHQGRGGHPVLIDLVYRDELLNLNAQRGLRALFDAHRNDMHRIPVECPYVARDMDTWEDYRRLHEEVLGTPPERV